MTYFEHQQSAHCESGVIANLLSHAGLPMSEAMAFGLGSGLAFAHIPVVKLNGQSLIAYRMPPRYIIRTLCKRLGVRLHQQRFRKVEVGQKALDQQLTAGKLVGLQTSVYWLPYFPADMRFHFNAHNLLVYGRENEEYLISDPVFEDVVRCPVADLNRARFAKGALAARGMMYHIDDLTVSPNWQTLIRKSLTGTTRIIGSSPLPWIGVRGVRHLGRMIARMDPQQHKRNSLFLTHIVRMQEEIGTGGAGFRFMYASFLQEASDKIAVPELAEIATHMTTIGDTWRQFAAECVRYSRKQDQELQALTQRLQQLSAAESALMKDLRKIATGL